MSVRDCDEGNEGSAAMSGGGDACVGSGGVSERDCCRLFGIIQELWKDLLYSARFFLQLFFNKIILLNGLERKSLWGW